MTKRPLSVAYISYLFIAAGVVGLVYHATEFNTQVPFDYEHAWVLFVRLLAIVGGVYTLRGANWARWLLLAWIAYHVYLSAFHAVSEVMVHAALMGVVAYVLFRPQASAYFRGVRSH